MNLIGNKEQSRLSIIQDPFKKDKVDGISIFMFSRNNGTFYWIAKVTFKNGNTIGEQKTSNCSSYEEVYTQLKQILESL